MNNKKKIFLSSILSLFFINLFPVYAQEEGFMPDMVNEWLKFIFIDLSDLAESGDQVFIIYSKIILFFLVFAILYWSSEKIFKEKARVAGTVAFIVALMSVILLPGNMILLIFKTYSTIIGFAFILLPVIVGLILAKNLADEKEGHEHWKRAFKGIIFIVIAILTFSLATTLTAEGSDVYIEVARWAKVGGVIALLIGIFYLLTCWRKKGEAQAVKT